MKHILIVRMSSLGDIVHTFPAATDVRHALPEATLDWVVEEQYAPLAAMHPGVTRLIPIAWRRWRTALHRAQTWRELKRARAALRERRYDAVLDTQGLLKSAIVARMARGPVHGFGPHTAREPIVSRFYDFAYEFRASDHKIERYRQVAARALGYAPPNSADYGIATPQRPQFAPSQPYGVLLHSTARAAKLWSESAWIELAQALERRGLTCVLPWGSDEERARSQRIAAPLSRGVVPAALSIGEAAGLIGHAAITLGVDTGLMHLAAALRVPVVAIFCDSEPLDAKPRGSGRTAYRGGIGNPPSVTEVLAALREVAPALG